MSRTRSIVALASVFIAACSATVCIMLLVLHWKLHDPTSSSEFIAALVAGFAIVIARMAVR